MQRTPNIVQVQGYLTYKKMHPPKSLPEACACGRMVVLGGGGGFV